MSLFDEEFEESLLDLRGVLCDERIAKYCIGHGIVWSDSAMVGSPTDNAFVIKNIAYKCTRKEAENFPQFKWVPMSELEGHQ